MPTRLIQTFIIFSLFSLPALARLSLPDLPEPVTNNAVALVTTDEGTYVLSFMGLGPGKGYRDVHNKVWALKLGDTHWQQRSPVPSSLALDGRLASVAVGIKGKAYIFGGYTVAEDHSEISSPDNFVYDVRSDRYQRIAATPVPVDDAVALVYRQRYIYLISGWHNDGNVNLVQLYDSQRDHWQQASSFPGLPVFGHAGGIIDRQMLICDGVKVQVRPKQRRRFLAEAACYSGTIDRNQPAKIDWRLASHPPARARYRMAATAIFAPQPGLVFVGGSVDPYNYDGMAYDGKPSLADNKLWFYSFSLQQWQLKTLAEATMDHRGLLSLDENTLVTVGGMQDPQQVSDKVHVIDTSILSD